MYTHILSYSNEKLASNSCILQDGLKKLISSYTQNGDHADLGYSLD